MQHTYLDIEMQVADSFTESDFNKDVICTYASTNSHDIILARYNTTILTFDSFMFTCNLIIKTRHLSMLICFSFYMKNI